jgi:hypothetical protein
MTPQPSSAASVNKLSLKELVEKKKKEKEQEQRS